MTRKRQDLQMCRRDVLEKTSAITGFLVGGVAISGNGVANQGGSGYMRKWAANKLVNGGGRFTLVTEFDDRKNRDIPPCGAAPTREFRAYNLEFRRKTGDVTTKVLLVPQPRSLDVPSDHRVWNVVNCGQYAKVNFRPDR